MIGGSVASADADEARSEALSAIEATGSDSLDAAATVDTASGIDAELSGARVEIPANPSGAVSITTEATGELSLGLPFSDTANTAKREASGVVSYDNNNGSSTVPIAREDGTVQVLTVITDEAAPTSYDYVLDIPVGGAARIEDGGVCCTDR